MSVRASLEDLCLRKAKATWSPSAEATATILKQQKFIDLQGTAEKVLQNSTHLILFTTDSFVCIGSKAI